MSGFWSWAFRLLYRILALIDPLVRAIWRRFGVGNVVELNVTTRSGTGTRSRLVGLLRVGSRSYFGNPNGHVGWTRDLAAAGGGSYRWPRASASDFRAILLPSGEEREQAIRATWQHPFPGNAIYRLARGHIRRRGVFFRVESLG